MATVVSITAARAQEIEDNSVVSGAIDSGSGHLILVTGDGTTIDAGVARPDAAIAAAVAAEATARNAAIAVETANRVTDVNTEEAARNAAITALVSDTGFVTALTGYTLATGWSTLVVRHRLVTIAAVEIVDLYFAAVRSGAPISNSGTSNIANTAVLNAIPAAIRPTPASIGAVGPGSVTGRIASFSISSSGIVQIVGLGGSADLATGETVTCRAIYFR